MTTIYVDGGGGHESKYGYIVKETGASRIVKEPKLTNNEAEYKAVLRALVDFADEEKELRILSDSKNTVNQLNHEFGINKNELRILARQIWAMIGEINAIVSFTWVPRNENLAGKMLGS